MSTAVNLDEKLVNDARAQAKLLSRSVTKQIEHWAKIGHIAEDNPDLNYYQIKDILLKDILLRVKSNRARNDEKEER